jgi:transcriptional regulator with XRE-family HTH domain
MTEEQVTKLLKAFVVKHGTYREAARAVGMSSGYLNDIVNGRRAPTDTVLAAIQVKRIITYKRAKIVA